MTSIIKKREEISIQAFIVWAMLLFLERGLLIPRIELFAQHPGQARKNPCVSKKQWIALSEFAFSLECFVVLCQLCKADHLGSIKREGRVRKERKMALTARQRSSEMVWGKREKREKREKSQTFFTEATDFLANICFIVWPACFVNMHTSGSGFSV